MQYTSEQLNFFRICFIAFNLFPKGLRKIFTQEWDFRYKTGSFGEWKDTPQNGRDFCSNESRKSRSKYARYLATIQNGNTAEWDCSCLFFAILFSDSIGTTLSAAIRREVDDLRQVRNDIAHNVEAKLTDAEFKHYVARVSLDFDALSLPVKDIDEVQKQTNFPTAEVANLMVQVSELQSELATTKSDLQVAQNTIQRKEEQVDCLTQEISSRVESFCELTFKPSHKIIRRSNDVTRIMTRMQELDDRCNGGVSAIYLSGNPGCGKSQIARQIGEEIFAVRAGDGEGLTFVKTLNAETLETLTDSYISLAKQLGITEYALTNLAALKTSIPSETMQHLKLLIFPKFKQFSKWLVIADNVVDLSVIRSHLPQAASEEWGRGQVLITTQDSSVIPTNAPHTYHESLSAGMQPEDAVELLKQISQTSNHEQAEKVAEVLEYQPLALAAAAFYVQTVANHGSPTYSWDKYLERFDRGEREGTEEPLAKENTAYSSTMTTAIKMALDRASKSDGVLREMFRLLLLCAPESLPIEVAINFVKARTSGKPEELIKATILKSSLITCLYDENEAPAYVRVHNIVHEVLRTVSMLDVELTACISEAIKNFCFLTLKESNHLFENGSACAKLRRVASHCKELHEILTTNFASKDALVKNLEPLISAENVASWLSSTAAVCCDLSNPLDANVFSTSACELVEYISSTREGQLLKADVLAVHGRVLSLQCEYELSFFFFFEEAKEISRSVLGKEHAAVAGSYINLGNVLRKLGDYSEAKEHYLKALLITKKTYGEEHADVVRSCNNLGIVHSDLRRHAKAKEYHEKALNIGKKIYGEDHADVARSYNNLGNVHSDMGQYSQARDYHEKALKIRRNIYGEEHADVAGSYNNLGNVFGNLGQHIQAKECHEKALRIRRKIYGERHAKVTESYHNLRLLDCGFRHHYQAKSSICIVL